MSGYAFDKPVAASSGVALLESSLATGGSVYLRNIRNSTLAQFVSTQMCRPPQELLSAFEELALMRDTVTRAVEMYAVAREAEMADPQSTAKRAIADRAAVLMNESLKEVVDLTAKAANIASTVHRTFSWGYINNILTIMLKAVSDVVGDDDVTLRAVQERLARDFDLLKEVTREDHDNERLILEMDRSIPAMEAS
jgi:hypothetical protein